MNTEELVEKVNSLLDEAAAADQFSGALLVTIENQLVLAAARGYAIQPGILANQPNTKFNIASITKMLTAVAVVQLVENGILDLHIPVSTYNPELPYADKITIHQLLTHTAGFGHYWNDAYRAARSDLRTISNYIKVFAQTPLEFVPGTHYRYGNSGYVLLGAIIEQVTNQSYYEYMHQAIFEPAGMKDTGHFELDLPIANRALGYTKDNWFGPEDGKLRSNHYIYAVKGSPSEHCFSTVFDLYNFFRALQDHRLLDADYLQACLTPHEEEKPGVSYGYGFHIIDSDKHGRSYGHGGRALGGDAFAMAYPDLEATIIVLSNYDRPAARQILNQVADILVE
jgi:CubicO group peptidase (beta-lactamase class C family)